MKLFSPVRNQVWQNIKNIQQLASFEGTYICEEETYICDWLCVMMMTGGASQLYFRRVKKGGGRITMGGAPNRLQITWLSCRSNVWRQFLFQCLWASLILEQHGVRCKISGVGVCKICCLSRCPNPFTISFLDSPRAINTSQPPTTPDLSPFPLLIYPLFPLSFIFLPCNCGQLLPLVLICYRSIEHYYCQLDHLNISSIYAFFRFGTSSSVYVYKSLIYIIFDF